MNDLRNILFSFCTSPTFFMKAITYSLDLATLENQNKQLNAAVLSERVKLRAFIRKRVARTEDAEDIFQDVLIELTEMQRLMKPVEHIASWLFTVARNKITDLYRKKKPEFLEDTLLGFRRGDENRYVLDDLLPQDSAFTAEDEVMRETIMKALMQSLSEMPVEQREVFVWHELEDLSFKDIVSKTGLPINTLLSRKRYAVLFLRERLGTLYNDIKN